MKLSIPYYSQYINVNDPEWQPRACGVVCLKMLLDSKHTQTTSLDEMIVQGDAIGAYGKSGWEHDGLVALAKQYGVKLERVEWRQSDDRNSDELNEEGINVILRQLEAGSPVIVSAIKNFEVKNKFHMVLIVGVEIEEGIVKGFYYHDSDSYTETKGAYQFVPFGIFSTAWRRMAIFAK